MGIASRVDALVIGAGVSGLTTALCLAEAGLTVRVLAKDPPQHTTSAVAGASWAPYLVDDPRLLDWSWVSLRLLTRLAGKRRTGVRLLSGREVSAGSSEPPSWARDVPGFRLCAPDELPAGYRSGWHYTIPIVDMPVYLDYLARRLSRRRVGLTLGGIGSLAECTGMARLLVNCTGLGARELVADRELVPIRGQLVVVDNPGIEEFFQDDSHGPDLTYILPHARRVILGGNALPGSEQSRPDPATTAEILARCVAVQPRLRGAKVRAELVGLRPARSTVRLEREELDGYSVIHNYGHGGSGVTMSWGCAQEVAQLAVGLLRG